MCSAAHAYSTCLLSLACVDAKQLKWHDLNRFQEAVLGYKQISVASSLNPAVDRIMLTMRRRVELYYPAGWRPETKCHCVIYYMLPSNDMNRTRIDGVEQISYQGGSAAVCYSCIDMLVSKAPMEKSRGCSFCRKQWCLPSFAERSHFAHRSVIRVDVIRIKRVWSELTSRSAYWRIIANNGIFLLKDKQDEGCAAGMPAQNNGHQRVFLTAFSDKGAWQTSASAQGD